LHWLDWHPVLMTFSNKKDLDLSMAVGFLGAGAALLLFVCTGMIYACMKFIQEWASPVTVLNFTLMGSASGFVLATAYAGVMASPLRDFYAVGALVLSVMALVGRLTSLLRNRSLKPLSTIQSAIGVRHRNLRQITRGFTAGAFNLKEFFHPGNPGMLPILTGFYLIIAFGIPVFLMALGWQHQSTRLFALAFVVQYIGLVAERWMFFAEARHPQNMYYQKVA
ncbi:MAG: dimethyl sulfoxide reductase anchor subunit, partial [Alphaproteobacteria bacterium]|nr:dimethyl sulfoxide reductase anchor subunit [Alphaproteobacteria bacterium]